MSLFTQFALEIEFVDFSENLNKQINQKPIIYKKTEPLIGLIAPFFISCVDLS